MPDDIIHVDRSAFTGRATLVGIMDILGYRSLVANNKIDEAARVTLSSILTVEKQTAVLTGRANKLEEALRPNVQGLVGRLHTQVFSDTIITHLAADGFLSWVVFLTYCHKIFLELFRAGLPVRGCIAEGQCFSNELCLVGQPLIDAHELAESLDLAGCVLTPLAAQAWTTAAAQAENSDFIEVTGRFHLLPTKSGTEQELFILHPMVRKAGTSEDIQALVYNHVHAAFAAHNKDIPPTAIRKLRNTVRVFTELYPYSALIPRGGN